MEDVLCRLLDSVVEHFDTILGGIITLVAVALGTLLKNWSDRIAAIRARRNQIAVYAQERRDTLLDSAREHLFGGSQVVRSEIEEWITHYDAEGRSVDLYRAALARADLRKLDLSKARMGRADLTLADASECVLRCARMQDAALRSTTLIGADLTRAQLGDADLSPFDNKTCTDLTDAKLIKTNLFRANLTGANLTGADLTDANLENAILKGAKVTPDQLRKAESLVDCTLPNGHKYPGPDEYLNEWFCKPELNGAG